MRNLFILFLIVVMALQAEEDGVFLFGNPSADLSIYLNTAAAKKKLDPQLYAQMMASVKKARRAGGIESDLPFKIDMKGRDWEVVVNLHFKSGNFTFLADGVANVTGGFQKEIESFARLFEGKCEISELELEGVTAKRFVFSPETVKSEADKKAKMDKKNDGAKETAPNGKNNGEPEKEDDDDDDDDDEDEDEDEEDDDIRSLDVLLASNSGERLQFMGGCNTPLNMDSVTWTKAHETNIFLYDDLILAAYFNIPKLLPLLPESINNPQGALLKGFLDKLTHVVVSFQPDGMDLVLHVRLVFKTEELASAMKPSIDQTVKALAQALTMLGGIQEPATGVRGKICDISGKINIKAASTNLEKMMH